MNHSYRKFLYFQAICLFSNKLSYVIFPCGCFKYITLRLALNKQISNSFGFCLICIKHCNKIFLELSQRQRNNI